MKKELALIFSFIGLSVTGHSIVLDLGEAQGYNAVIFGDHTATKADTEGRLAVGGNASLPGSYSVGETGASGAPQNPQSNGTRDDLVVKGNLTLTGGNVSVDFGNVKVGGSISGPGVITQGGTNNATTDNVPNLEANILNFTQIESTVRSYSSQWAGLATTGTVSVLGSYQLSLTGTSTTLNIFNVTASEWTNSDRYIDVPVDSTVIINILGTAVSVNGGTIFFGPDQAGLKDAANYRSNVIYNLHDATTLQTESFTWEGSVFAPNAALTTTTGGAINGQAFVSESNQLGNFEYHNFSLLAENAPIPEPSQAAALLGVTALAIAAQRRRR